MANRYSRFTDQFESAAKFRPIYGDDNVDPYALTRVGQAGRRQESYKDILRHGERSDTDWRQAAEDNLKALRDNYTPGGQSFGAAKGAMDKTSRNLYNATYGFEQTQAQIAGQTKRLFGGTRSTDSQLKQFEAYKSARFDTDTGQKIKGAGADETLSVAQNRRFSDTAGNQAKLLRGAVKLRDESRAKWMASFNTQTNQAERIAKSQTRTANMKRFEALQISRKSQTERRIRATKSRGATGLVSGAGTGLGIPL